jgi:site-specific recombinase XerD
VKTGRLACNPAQDVRAPKQLKMHKRDALTLLQAQLLVGSVDTSTVRGLRDAAILALMLRAGLRDIEVSRANVEDLREGTVRWRYGVQGKGRDSADEFVILNAREMQALSVYLETRGPLGPSSPIIAAVDGRGQGRLSTRQNMHLVADRLDAAGLKTKTITAHRFRHTAATLAVAGGRPPSRRFRRCCVTPTRARPRGTCPFTTACRTSEYTLNF